MTKTFTEQKRIEIFSCPYQGKPIHQRLCQKIWHISGHWKEAPQALLWTRFSDYYTKEQGKALSEDGQGQPKEPQKVTLELGISQSSGMKLVVSAGIHSMVPLVCQLLIDRQRIYQNLILAAVLPLLWESYGVGDFVFMQS